MISNWNTPSHNQHTAVDVVQFTGVTLMPLQSMKDINYVTPFCVILSYSDNHHRNIV